MQIGNRRIESQEENSEKERRIGDCPAALDFCVAARMRSWDRDDGRVGNGDFAQWQLSIFDGGLLRSAVRPGGGARQIVAQESKLPRTLPSGARLYASSGARDLHQE